MEVGGWWSRLERELKERIFLIYETLTTNMLYYIGLNVSLVPAFLPIFGISPCTFFCLVLVPTLCKSIAIGPSVNKKKLELTELLLICFIIILLTNYII